MAAINSTTTHSNILFTTYKDPNRRPASRVLALRNLIDSYGIGRLVRCLNDHDFTCLELSDYRKLSEKQIIALSAALKTSTFISELNLHSCEIRGFGLRNMTKEIISSRLTKLDLSSNKLGDLGAELIAKILEENNTLTHLELEDNCIGIEGGKVIGQALRKNSGLQVLNLGYNQLEYFGAIEIVKGIADHTNLLELDLSNNGIEEASRPSFTMILIRNISLKTFNGFKIGANDRQEVKSFFERI